MLTGLLGAAILLAAPPSTGVVLDTFDPQELPGLEWDLPGKVFAATKLVDPSEPLGTEGQAIPLADAKVDVVLFTKVVATLAVDKNGRFVVPKGTKASHVEVTAPGRELAIGYLHEVEEWVQVMRTAPWSGQYPSYEPVKQKIDPETGLIFLLRRTANYSGRVVDGEGKPIAGATVRVRSAVGFGNAITNTRREASMTTKADGRFSLDYAPGKIAVDARLGKNFCVNTAFRENVAPGEKVSGLELVIKKRASFQVRVTRLREPVAGADVRRCIASNPDLAGWAVQEAKTDAQGVASFDDVIEGEPAPIVARHPIAGIAVKQTAPTASGAMVDLALMPGATIQGFVKTPEGKPLPGATVSISLGSPLSTPATAGLDKLALGCAGSLMGGDLTTNAEGYFRRSDLLHDVFSIEAEKKGYAAEHDFSPPANVNFVLRVAGAVRGRIRRPDGIALPGEGGSIVARKAGSTFSTRALDDEYSLDVPPGEWEIHYVDVNGKKTKPFPITVEEDPLEIVFDAPE